MERLLEEERKAVTECRDTVTQWEKFHDDYQALQQRLTTLPDRLKHDVMVPIGKHAFMPGQLYHTNEITVLLGDNWFAQVTAKQAGDIVSRRQKVVEEKLSDAKRQLEDIEAKLAFATAFQQQDAVEIKEELDDNRPISKRRIAHTRKTPSVVKATEKKAQDSDDDDELWKRLNELEHQVEERSQQEDNGYQQKDEETNSAVASADTANNVINISHTSLLMPTITSDKTHTSGIINSPADICVKKSSVDSAAHVDEPVVKSKSVHWSSDIASPPQPSPENLTEMPAGPKPFTRSVVEKSTPTTVSTETGRKVSRFKASRQT